MIDLLEFVYQSLLSAEVLEATQKGNLRGGCASLDTLRPYHQSSAYRMWAVSAPGRTRFILVCVTEKKAQFGGIFFYRVQTI